MICTLKHYEWEALAQLLKQGYPFREAYELMQGDVCLLYAMEQGKSIEECLVQGHNEMFYDHLRFFMKIAALPEAIQSALSIADITHDLKTKLRKEISYPLLLFVLSFLTLILFTSLILPQLMQGFDVSSNRFLIFSITTLQALAVLLIWGIILCLLITILMIRSVSVKLWILRKLRFTKLPQQYCSYLAASYFTQFMRHGISTKNAVSFLTHLKQTSLLAICACQIEAELKSGTTLTDCFHKQEWLDTNFIKHWEIGSHTKQLETVLLQYQNFQSEQWKQLLKRIGQGIQIFSYGFVGCMVLLVYQIMLVPLQLLETM